MNSYVFPKPSKEELEEKMSDSKKSIKQMSELNQQMALKAFLKSYQNLSKKNEKKGYLLMESTPIRKSKGSQAYLTEVEQSFNLESSRCNIEMKKRERRVKSR